MNKFVLGVVVGVVMIAGIVVTCSERLTVGKAEAYVNCIGCPIQPFYKYYECDVNKTCTRWAYGWHKQHQRVKGEVQTVEVREWFCIGWEPVKGVIIPACDNEIMTREAGW